MAGHHDQIGTDVIGMRQDLSDSQEFWIWSEALTDEQIACLYDVAVEPTLLYTATQFEQLLQVYRDVVPTSSASSSVITVL